MRPDAAKASSACLRFTAINRSILAMRIVPQHTLPQAAPPKPASNRLPGDMPELRSEWLRSATATIVMLLVLCLLAGCHRSSKQAAAPAAADASTPAPRIVCTVPAITQILLQIGAASDLKGVSSFDAPLLPKSLRNLPVVGDYEHIDYETLAALEPTIIIIQIAPLRVPPALPSFALTHHAKLLDVSLTSLADIAHNARLLGRLTHRQKQAAAAIARMEQQLSQLATQKPAKPVRVLYLISRQPMMAVGADNFQDQLIRAAGGMNVGAKLGSGYPTLNRETLVQLRPQVLVIDAPGSLVSQGPDDPRLAGFFSLPIPAAKTGRIYLLTNMKNDLPTLAVGSTAQRLRKLFYPPPATGGTP